MHWPLLHPRSRRTPPSATPSPTPTRRSSRQVLASAPAGNTAATRSRLLSPTHTQNTLHTARPAPPVTLGRLSWTKPPARAHLLRTPRQPCLPAPPPEGRTHGCPPALENYTRPSHRTTRRLSLGPAQPQPPATRGTSPHARSPQPTPCHPHQNMPRAARTPTATPSCAPPSAHPHALIAPLSPPGSAPPACPNPATPSGRRLAPTAPQAQWKQRRSPQNGALWRA